MSQRINVLCNELVMNKCMSSKEGEYVGSNKQSKNSGGTADILPAERKKATFDVKKLIVLLDGGEKINKKKNFIRSPLIKNDFSYKYNLSRTEYFKNHVKYFIDVHKKFANYQHSDRRDFSWMAEVAQWNGGLMNAHGIYLGAVASLGDQKQAETYCLKALKFEIVGCYAQTELGHGSNVRGLQTTATYDAKTQEFIMDTPTLQSIKWWPGALGVVSTHACVFAQLIIDNKEYGLHAFMVQLRDENHKHLPGIETGDLGPKLGDVGNDTGFLIMNKIRIPRACMLSKYSEVTPDGNYVKKGQVDKKAHYSTMMFARIHIIHVVFSRLAQAATIAARYSCVRKQGFKDTSEDVSFLSEEYQIIDYKMQRYRVFKQLSIAYVIKATANWMFNFASSIEEGTIGQIKINTNLKEIAAISAGIKGLCTIIAADGIEDLRKCCGGNGYLLNSGIGQIILDNLLYVTAEGDFSLMLLLTSKYLIKVLQKIITTGQREKGVLDYLNAVLEKDFKQKIDQTAPIAKSFQDFFDLNYLLNLFKFRAVKKISYTGKKLQNKIMNEGLTIEEAANFCQIDLRKSSENNSYYILMKNFIDFISSIQNEPQIINILTKICALFACTNILDGDWNGVLRHDQFELVQEAVDQLLNEIRPDCIALVDSFDFPDMALNSTIGSYDGNVYERLINAARSSELNKKIPFEGYEEFLSPHIDKEFLKKKGQL